MKKAKSFSPTSYYSGNKTPQQGKKKGSLTPSGKKDEWNYYLTDSNKFRATDEEILKRKQLLVSKHNILSDSYTPPKYKSKVKQLLKSSNLKEADLENESDAEEEITKQKKKSVTKKRLSADNKKVRNENANADLIDLLELDSEEDDDEEISDYESDDDEEENEDGERKKLATKKNKNKKRRSSLPYKLVHPGKDYHSTDLFDKTLILNPHDTTNETNNDDDDEEDPVTSSSFSNAFSPSIFSQQTIKWPTKPTPTSSKTSKKDKKNKINLHIKEQEKIPDEELKSISNEISLLLQELQYYEELSGKRSILKSQEFSSLLSESELKSGNIDQKKVIQLLVHLVCQTMTYLLKSEVDQNELKSEIESLKTKYNDLQESIRNPNKINIIGSQQSLLIPSSSSLYQTTRPLQQHEQQQMIHPSAPVSKKSTSSSGYLHHRKLIPEGEDVEEQEARQEIKSNLDAQFRTVQNEQDDEEREDELEENDDEEAVEEVKGVEVGDINEEENDEISLVHSSVGSSSYQPLMTSTSSAVIQQQTLQKINNSSRNNSHFNNTFTGTSPTDLLFSPAALSKMSPLSSTIPATGSGSAVPKNINSKVTATPDFTTPLPAYRSHNNVNALSSAHTTDLLTGDFTSSSRRATEQQREDQHQQLPQQHDAELSFDDDQINKLKDRLLLNVRDSTESTIERLSYQFTNDLTSSSSNPSASSHAYSSHTMNSNKKHVSPTSVASLGGGMPAATWSSSSSTTTNVTRKNRATTYPNKEESSSFVSPNNNMKIPVPVQQPQHPFTTTTGKENQKAMLNATINTSKSQQPQQQIHASAVNPISVEKKIYDARFGSF